MSAGPNDNRERTGLGAELEALEASDPKVRAAAENFERAKAEILAKAAMCPPHKWDDDGERCEKCGAKDWMTG